jgi:hypothetical protein
MYRWFLAHCWGGKKLTKRLTIELEATIITKSSYTSYTSVLLLITSAQDLHYGAAQNGSFEPS